MSVLNCPEFLINVTKYNDQQRIAGNEAADRADELAKALESRSSDRAAKAAANRSGLVARYVGLMRSDKAGRKEADAILDLADQLGFTPEQVRVHRLAVAAHDRMGELKGALASAKTDQRDYMAHHADEWSTEKYPQGRLRAELEAHWQADQRDMWKHGELVTQAERNIRDAEKLVSGNAFLFEGEANG